jgi:predicted ATPase
MKITIPEKIPNGSDNTIKRLPFFKSKTSLELEPATVLTGANGSGKTSFINALAAGLGMCDNYVTRRASKEASFPEVALDRAIRLWGLLNTDSTFDEVYRFSGGSGGKRPLSADTMEDIVWIMGSKASHGEVNLNRLIRSVLRPAKEKREKGDSILLLIDEPECGLSPERVSDVEAIVRSLVFDAINNSAESIGNLTVLVSTQSPLILFGTKATGANHIDMGGWQSDKDPFMALFECLKVLVKAQAWYSPNYDE